jgi:hypothetical protein
MVLSVVIFVLLVLSNLIIISEMRKISHMKKSMTNALKEIKDTSLVFIKENSKFNFKKLVRF